MQSNVIKRLYDGELVPCEHRVASGSQRETVSREVSKKAECLKKELTDQQKKLFEEILSDQMLLGALAEEDGFEMGFRLGGQFMVSILVDPE